MKLVSGMARNLSEERKRHKETVLSEIERVRKIVHNNGSAAEDMAGGLRKLTSVLRKNEGEYKKGGEGAGRTDEEGQAPAKGRGRKGRAPSSEEQEPRGFYDDWSSKQKELWKRQNPLTLSFKKAEGSPCEVLDREIQVLLPS